MGKISNYRFADDVLAAIDGLQERWGSKSQVEAVSRAILEAYEGKGEPQPNGLLQKVYERQLHIELMCEELIEMGQSVPEPHSHLQPAMVGGLPAKRFRCEHCGTSPAVARVGDICQDCATSGHAGEPRDCGKCAASSPSGGAL